MLFSTLLIWTYIELGETKKAKSLIDDLNEFASESKNKELLSYASTVRAMWFRAQKKWNKSIEYFEESLQEHEALNARRWNLYHLARWVFYEYARVYLERRKKGDREKALRLLNQAQEIFEKQFYN